VQKALLWFHSSALEWMKMKYTAVLNWTFSDEVEVDEASPDMMDVEEAIFVKFYSDHPELKALDRKGAIILSIHNDKDKLVGGEEFDEDAEDEDAEEFDG
jgi:hypothetical protein